jgi:membrane-associated phospholipid phosphatase
MKLFLVLFTLFIFQTGISHSQIITEPSDEINTGLGYNIKNDVNSFYKTTTGIFNSPFQFGNDDFILTGIIIGATAFSLTFDNPVRNNVAKIQSPALDRVTRVGENFGSGKYVLGLSGALYIGGHIFADKEIRMTGLMLTEAIILNGIVTVGLKVITGRSRPFRNNGNTDIDFLEMEFEDIENSLPSGHTSTAFTVATVLSERIDNIYASVALYSLAGLTAFQRIYSDKHWLSDTVLGAALGTVIGLKVVKLNSEADDPSSLNLNVTPVVSSGGFGVGLVLNF